MQKINEKNNNNKKKKTLAWALPNINQFIQR